ncbi:hypothetical protein C8Q80DRAFT_1166538 [Daedaleopsis nitida]|nr:hypothetical protein C8Q80DRAFT_1166538 [Daedaleopsis nitida]
MCSCNSTNFESYQVSKKLMVGVRTPGRSLDFSPSAHWTPCRHCDAVHAFCWRPLIVKSVNSSRKYPNQQFCRRTSPPHPQPVRQCSLGQFNQSATPLIASSPAFSPSLAVATPAPAADSAAIPALMAYGGSAEAHAEPTAVLSTQSGCGSTGPLGPGHYIWWIVVGCNAGQRYTCQATDATGCIPGDRSHIGSIEVDDPNDTFQVASARDANSVDFTCPSIGQVRCEVNFNENSHGPNYSLRVFQ